MTHQYSDVVDELGPCCPKCRSVAFVTKIETGPRIGQRFSFECVEGHKFKAQKDLE